MTLKSYSLVNVATSADGELIKSHNGVEVEYQEDRWKFSEAATGEVTRARSDGRLGTITIKNPQTSMDNSKLDDLIAEQDAIGVGAIPKTVSLQIKDNWGKSLHSMPQATLVKKPKADYSKDPTDRVWVFKGELTNHTVGGNN